MSDGKMLSFAELTDEKELLADCIVKTVELNRGTVRVASANSEGILAWFEESDSADLAVRRYKGLRLVVRCLLNPDGSRVVKDGSAGSAEILAAVEALRKRDSNANAKLIEAAFEVNGMQALPTAPKNEPGVAQTSDASPSDSPDSSASST